MTFQRSGLVVLLSCTLSAAGSKWRHTRVQRFEKQRGFRLDVWNRVPQRAPIITLMGKDVGTQSDAEAMQVQLKTPALRQPAGFE